MFKHFKFKGFNLTKLHFDYYIEMPYHFETKESDTTDFSP